MAFQNTQKLWKISPHQREGAIFLMTCRFFWCPIIFNWFSPKKILTGYSNICRVKVKNDRELCFGMCDLQVLTSLDAPYELLYLRVVRDWAHRMLVTKNTLFDSGTRAKTFRRLQKIYRRPNKTPQLVSQSLWLFKTPKNSEKARRIEEKERFSWTHVDFLVSHNFQLIFTRIFVFF